jgi:hypothetical protein
MGLLARKGVTPLAVVQVLLALWLYRKLPLAGTPPRLVRPMHRAAGFALFALSLPIAVHCLLAYGVQLTSARIAHSLAGCFFYGAFTAKVLLVQSRRLPRWLLPAAGGTLALTAGCCGARPRCGSTAGASFRSFRWRSAERGLTGSLEQAGDGPAPE